MQTHDTAQITKQEQAKNVPAAAVKHFVLIIIIIFF